MAKTTVTVQGEILRAVGVLLAAVVLLSALAFYAVLDAKKAFREKSQAQSALNAEIQDLRVALAQSAEASSQSARARLQSLTERAQAHDGELNESLSWLILVLIPIALIALVVPAVWLWGTSKAVNRQLAAYVRTLSELSEQNDLTSETLKGSAEHLSSSSSEQSAAVQETVASIAQIRSMLAQTSNHVREVQNLASTVNDKTHDGSAIMNRMEAAMMAIEQANTQMQAFVDIIGSIKEKTQIINEIVFKTQLLSFNASIEAARAGQYGRGFAVVAEEVGKLAHTSGNASKEIDQLLSDSQNRVNHIVHAVEERVRDGKVVSGEALKRFAEIAKQIGIISEKINQVGEATLEQEGGVEQTARAMDQMDETAAHNRRASEQIYKNVERLRNLGARIREVTDGIRRFVRDAGREAASQEQGVGGGDPVTHAAPVSEQRVNQFVREFANRLPEAPDEPVADLTADDPSFRRTGTGD